MTTDHRFPRLAKEAGWIAAGQIGAVLGALVLVRVLTEHLESTQYGELALALTIAGLVNQVVMGGVSSGIGRFYSIAAEQDDLAAYWQASRRLMGYAAAAVLAFGTLLMSAMLWSSLERFAGLAVAAVLLAFVGGMHACLLGIQNAARQRAAAALYSGTDAWLKIVLAVGMMQCLGRSSTAVVLGYALSSLLVTGLQLASLQRQISIRAPGPAPGTHWMSKIWTFSWPFTMWGTFTWAQQASDRWALEAFTSTREVGLYSVVFQLGYVPIGLATGMATTLLGPILYQRAGNATDQARNASVHRIAWRMAQIALVLTGLAFVLTFGLHELIFRLIVAEAYYGTSHLLPWVILAGGLFASAQMLALKLLSEMKPVVMTAVKIVTAGLGIGLNAYGAAYHGVPGVVFALLGCSVIYLLWMAWLARHPEATDSSLSST